MPAPDPIWFACIVVGGLAAGGLIWAGRPREKTIVRLGGLGWTTRDFVRGWFITGDIGSGKTSSGIVQLLRQLFLNVPNWGGLCIDEKGVFAETLISHAEHFGRKEDVLVLTVRPDNGAPDWRAECRYNLVGDRRIPNSAYASMVIDMVLALGQENDQSFFREQAELNIAAALEALALTGLDVTLENVYTIFHRESEMRIIIGQLHQLKTPAALRLASHFEEFLGQPHEQRHGTMGTVNNYLRHFSEPDVAEVFCRDSTFDLAAVDQGRILCLQMPKRMMKERRYVGVFLKGLFYLHVLRRYDRPAGQRATDNLLVVCVDEAQRFVTSAKSGFGEHQVVDIVREAGCAVILATQSVTSFVPPLGKPLTQTVVLNLRNRIAFCAADDEDAEEVARRIGKRKKKKTSYSHGRDGTRRNVAEEEEFILSPHKIRKLRPHQCILIHARHRHRRVTLPPLEADGRVASWYRRW